MSSIEQIQIRNTPDATRTRIQELKARAAEGLDDALSEVTRNLGRKETVAAENSLKDLGQQLTGQDAPKHTLELSRVLDLISDPFVEG